MLIYPDTFHSPTQTIQFIDAIQILARAQSDHSSPGVLSCVSDSRLIYERGKLGDMSSDPEVDTSRTVVQAYVPAYQRDAWDEHADELGMSRSEFVKMMVQTGRHHIGDGDIPDLAGPEEGESGDSTDSSDLSADIVELLGDAGALSWDELLAALTDDIETRLDDALQELQEENRIRYSGRENGYVLAEDER